jgi:asparagine synthase (glutamine-hydrolysing)
VVFLDPDVVDYALRIPTEHKLHNGVMKWILREVMAGKLPESVLHLQKVKFWQRAGVEDVLAQHAEKKISFVLAASLNFLW